MTCQEFWISVAPPAAAGPPDMNAGERSHLDQCAACAAEFARHCRLAESLALAGRDLRRIQAPGRVEARLLAAFRWQGAAPKAVRNPWLAPVIWWAAAAALLVCAGLFLTGGRQPLPARHVRPSPVQWADVVLPAEVEAGAEAQDETTAGFIPVPNADKFASNDEQVDLVRVEIPRSAMIAFGIPVSAEDAADRVEADVLLGPDGLARAVRFVN